MMPRSSGPLTICASCCSLWRAAHEGRPSPHLPPVLLSSLPRPFSRLVAVLALRRRPHCADVAGGSRLRLAPVSPPVAEARRLPGCAGFLPGSTKIAFNIGRQSSQLDLHFSRQPTLRAIEEATLSRCRRKQHECVRFTWPKNRLLVT